MSKYFIKMVILIARKIYGPPFIHAFKVDIKVKNLPSAFTVLTELNYSEIIL